MKRSIFGHFALGTFPLRRRIARRTVCRVFGCRWNGLFCNRCWY